MNVSTRYTVALHLLTLLAARPDEALTSEFLADSVNTNPVVVRRLMKTLREVGWVSSRPGTGGGWELTVNPGHLTLAVVRQAMNEGSPFAMHNQQPNPHCPVGRNIQQALGHFYKRAENAMDAELARTTIKSLLRSVQHLERG